MIVPGMLACRNFLISVYMFYCIEIFAHIECYSDCFAQGDPFGLNPFCYGVVSYRVLCFVAVLRGCVWYVRNNALLQCPLQLLRGWIWALYEVPFSMFLLGFGMRTMLANFHM